jgi:hypothetical protein
VFARAVIVIGSLTPGYDQWSDAVSRLASPAEPWALAALPDAHPQTGLKVVPFLLAGLDEGDPSRPWDSEEFAGPLDAARADHLDAAQIFTGRWDDETPSGEEQEEFEE